MGSNKGETRPKLQNECIHSKSHMLNVKIKWRITIEENLKNTEESVRTFTWIRGK